MLFYELTKNVILLLTQGILAGKDVAVKVMKAKSMGSWNIADHYREVNALKLLSHYAIIPIEASFFYEYLFIATPLAQGKWWLWLVENRAHVTYVFR